MTRFVRTSTVSVAAFALVHLLSCAKPPAPTPPAARAAAATQGDVPGGAIQSPAHEVNSQHPRWEFAPEKCELAYARDGWLVWRRSEIVENQRHMHAPLYRIVCWRQRWGDKAAVEVYDGVATNGPTVGGVLADGTVMLVASNTVLWVRAGEKPLQSWIPPDDEGWYVVRLADPAGVVLQKYLVSPRGPGQSTSPTNWVPWKGTKLDHSNRVEIAPAGELEPGKSIDFLHAGRYLLWGKWVYDLKARSRRELPVPPDKSRYVLCDGEVAIYHGLGGSGTYAVSLGGEHLPVNGNWLPLAIRDGLLYGAIGRDPTRIVAVNVRSGAERQVAELKLADFPYKCRALETPARLEIWNDGKWTGVPWLAPADRP